MTADWKLRDRAGKVRLRLRKVYEADPEAFAIVMKELDARADWRDCLPPVPRDAQGKPRKVDDGVLARLLVEYLDRPEGVTRDEFINSRDCSPEHFRFEWVYGAGRWNDRKIGRHLKTALKKYKTDPAFTARVEDLRRGH